jgi:hypothetical protein
MKIEDIQDPKAVVPVKQPRASTLPGYDPKNPMHSAWAAAFRRRKHSAPKEGKAFTITQAEAWEIINKQDWHCALTGIAFTPGGGRSDTQPSMDRINSSAGYEPGNVQFLTLRVNYCKRELSDANFVALCKQVASHN